MRSFKTSLLAGAALALLGASAAQAGSYKIAVTTGLIGSGFETLNTLPAFSGPTASATFTYTGDLNFNNTEAQNTPSGKLGDLNSGFGFTAANVSGYGGGGSVTYQGTQVAYFNTEARFISSSGSVAGYGYGSHYAITLGSLAAGTSLTITHDDGISLYRDGVRVPGGVSGPTNAVTDTFSNLAAGTYTLYYSRQNGTPSVLQVAVPEPTSLALFGAGLLGLGYVRRRRNNQAG
ncbi:PEP-CTERM sorting domain-containing protein [Pararoseomonas indoligenes]|uniref:PEP-CTERM sorting domain-containing protein n=1 Tax=Roseomonas indoligenes TaxID=2820811 RepID=A0A940S8H4_9PROT|nr:PEP-CTERM sorting domain-containing protein [Pararoseomonas indoligenes]MBP0494112.1 PEP-CTERM sorting domain-containing protein [Pararoseomonas indoligenes]